ncbi:MAG: serine/threonine protein kinase [Polyangiaceae bacterium]|nr:serine/threonine protein kinase [Polyangiaceae bacterium]
MNATDPLAGPEPRTSLGRYDLLTRLGSGGMADVYLAVARGPAGFHKLSVLKVLRPHVAHDDEFFAMFLDEARLSANFSHPNVVHTHGVEEDGDQHFLVLEYLEGRSLAQLHAEQRDLPLPLQLRALTDVLHGLHYVHELTSLDGQPYNIVHRDVSPQNVFVTYGGTAKLLDFGVAKARNALAHTREGTYKGKVRYMAPEQLLGEPIDHRADIFAAGILLFRALTGRRLWEGLDQLAVMHRLAARVPVPAPSSLVSNIPRALDDACVQALSLQPSDRFATASELANVLEDHLRTLGGEGSHRRFGRFLEERYARERADFQANLDSRLRALRHAPATVPLARGSGGHPSSQRIPFVGDEHGGSTQLTPSRPFPPSGSHTLPPGAPASGTTPAAPALRSYAPAASATRSSVPAAPAAQSSVPAAQSSAPAAQSSVPAAPAASSSPSPPPAPISAPAPFPAQAAFSPFAAPVPSAAAPASFVAPETFVAPATSVASAAFAPTPSPAPAPAAPPHRLSAPLVLGALLVIVAAGVAPWLPRLWPRLQATFSQGAPSPVTDATTLASTAASALSSPAHPSSSVVAAALPSTTPPPSASTPAASAPAPHEAPPTTAASEGRERPPPIERRRKGVRGQPPAPDGGREP